ncbi:MAG TPA: RNA 2',3'-cyclic phosphodiesterase [Balneolaceae bacterium]|nr:RNA 2',3'-cyclic phosphodiesterase [Balneolaceae bacterium]
MRLFIAIPLPDHVKNVMIGLQESIDGIKWQSPDQMHLTLKFLGETPRDELSTIYAQLENISQQEFILNVKGVGVFPNLRAPRVIWAGVKKSDPLAKLYRSVEKQCQNAGFEPEKRSFKPHITLGRVKGAPAHRVKRFVQKEQAAALTAQMTVDRFNLYRSKLTHAGAVHTVVKEFPLSG